MRARSRDACATMDDHRRVKTRETEAIAKREEQLRNFQKSDMCYELVREHIAQTIKFAWSSMFHAACAAGDQDEMRKLLDVDHKADINVLNIDGLSALHQAAIDNNLDMVKCLVNWGADINVEDRECWTPLHATVNCGHVSIARYLIDNGADLAAVNSDGNLPIDIAEIDEMKALIQEAVANEGIDCDLARKSEERTMTGDAIYWAMEGHALRQAHPQAGKVDPETGITALHVAAAKCYMQSLRLLIYCCKVDLNVQDVDGWTPLHAAAYWGQKDAIETLMSAGADTSIRNCKGELFVDLANDDIVDHIKKIEKEPNSRKQARRMFKGPFDYKMSKTRERESASKKDTTCGPFCEVARIDEELAMLNIAERWASDMAQELIIEPGLGDSESGRTLLHKASAKGYMKLIEVLVTRCFVDLDAEDNEGWTPLHFAVFYNQMDAVAYLISWGASTTIKNKKGDNCMNVATEVMGHHISCLLLKAKGRRRLPPNEDEIEITKKRRELKIKIKSYLSTLSANVEDKNNLLDQSSNENKNVLENNAKPKSNALPNSADRVPIENSDLQQPTFVEEMENTAPPTEYPPTENDITEISQKPQENMISSDEERKGKSTVENVNEKGYTNATAVNSTTVQPKLSPGNIFKNFFKSFVPPTRDEESATQRKAHAKRIRETRRSTQGISLEEIQNAEMLIRKNTSVPNSTNEPPAPPVTERIADDVASSVSDSIPVATISSKAFALEDASKNDGDHGKHNNATNSNSNLNEVADTITIPLRRPAVSNEEKQNERLRAHSAKYPDSNVPKNNIRRRSTGITQINSDPIEDNSKKLLNNDENIIDYKKLYEMSQIEIERLNKIIKSFEEQSTSKGISDKSYKSTQDLNSEKEKREKRALQRKLSEMEEELRQQKALQTENQRLKDENGALIRVISKLSK